MAMRLVGQFVNFYFKSLLYVPGRSRKIDRPLFVFMLYHPEANIQSSDTTGSFANKTA